MHTYLMGYRGSGKTTTAKLLSQALDRHMVDTDDWIESAAGDTIRHIFATQGEQAFRDLEQTAIRQVAESAEPLVVALGGGAVLRPANQQVIRQTGHCVWLDASVEQLYTRICADSSTVLRRPDLTDRGGLEEVAEVLAQRRPIYQSLAELTVCTTGRSPDEIVEDIVVWLRSLA
ncbi:MAG: shikimate kinase [Pirellulaceae bacterium]|nr:shikimate kinase [Pirellulaceae bacterium]